MSRWALKKSTSSPKVVFLLRDMARVLIVEIAAVQVQFQRAVPTVGSAAGAL